MIYETVDRHEVTFSVQYFERGDNGRSDRGVYGNDVKNMQDAILLLKRAEDADKNAHWVIVCEVVTQTKGKQL